MYIDETASIAPGAFVEAPAYLGPGVVVRHGAYIRQDCILLDGSLLGHASEAKGALFLPEAKAPHFAYVGDSVLGHRVNLGAGTKLSNVSISNPRRNIHVIVDDVSVDTGLRKLGAVLGDDVQIGCNAVLSPGTFLGANSIVYPNTSVPKGFHGANTIIKLRQTLQAVDRA